MGGCGSGQLPAQQRQILAKQSVQCSADWASAAPLEEREASEVWSASSEARAPCISGPASTSALAPAGLTDHLQVRQRTVKKWIVAWDFYEQPIAVLPSTVGWPTNSRHANDKLEQTRNRHILRIILNVSMSTLNIGPAIDE